MKRILFATIALALLSTAAAAQTSVTDGLAGLGEASASGRIVQMIAAVTVLSVAPGLLIMVTSFTRFVIALSFLRSGLGLQTTPANLIMISLALFMTFYVMAPTLDKSWQDGVKPLIEAKITEEQAYDRIVTPSKPSCAAMCEKRTCACSRTSPGRSCI